MPHYVTPKIGPGGYPHFARPLVGVFSPDALEWAAGPRPDHLRHVVHLEFICTEEPGSACKLVCPTDPTDPYCCETYHLAWIDGEPWHVGWDDELDDERPLHKMLPTDSCTILAFDYLDECFAGDYTDLRAGEIAFTWSPDDESYVWTYASDAPERKES